MERRRAERKMDSFLLDMMAAFILAVRRGQRVRLEPMVPVVLRSEQSYRKKDAKHEGFVARSCPLKVYYFNPC